MTDTACPAHGARGALLEEASRIARDLGQRIAELADALADEKAEASAKSPAGAEELPTLSALFYGEKPAFEERFAAAAADAGRLLSPLDALRLVAEANDLIASESAAAGLEPPCDFEEAGWCALLDEARTAEAREALFKAFEAHALEEEAAGNKRGGLLARAFAIFEFGGLTDRQENERVIALIDRSAPLLEGRWSGEAQKRRQFLRAANDRLEGRL